MDPVEGGHPEASKAGQGDYYSGEYLQDIAEHRLLEDGGPELLQAAHDEAAARVDVLHPWHGQGVEPEQRVSAYISVLWEWVEQVE